MAGIYADIPGTRFALDQDGTVMKWRDYTLQNSWTDVSASIAETQKVNTANLISLNGNTSANYTQLAVAFPEARTINGIFSHLCPNWSGRTAANFTWEYSTDTSDGTDGTWTTFTVTYNSLGQHDNINNTPKPYYRSDIATVALSSVKGLRVRWNDGGSGGGQPMVACVLHIYGSRPNTSVDRLDFWHPTNDQEIGAAALDFGDMAQGTTATRQFRLKNLSSTLTANTITLQVSDLLPEYTSGELQVSTDNVTFQSSLNIGNLAPGAISSVLYVKRIVAAGETTTQRQARLLATAASWS